MRRMFEFADEETRDSLDDLILELLFEGVGSVVDLKCCNIVCLGVCALEVPSYLCSRGRRAWRA